MPAEIPLSELEEQALEMAWKAILSRRAAPVKPVRKQHPKEQPKGEADNDRRLDGRSP